VVENILAHADIWRSNVHQEGIAHPAARYPQPKAIKFSILPLEDTKLFPAFCKLASG